MSDTDTIREQREKAIMSMVNRAVVHALTRACPAYEFKPNPDQATQEEIAKWEERMDIADRIIKLISEYEDKSHE